MEEKQVIVSTKKKIFIAVFITCVIIIGICGSLLLIRFISNSSFNSAVDNVTKAVKTGFPGRNEITVSGHTVYIKLWNDGLFKASKLAAMGNEEALKNWNELRDKMYLTVCDLSDLFLLVDNATLYFYFVSEQDHDSELLVYKNKTLVYDGVQEYLSQNGG